MDKQTEEKLFHLESDILKHINQVGFPITHDDLSRNRQIKGSLGFPYFVSGDYTPKHLELVDETLSFMFSRYGTPQVLAPVFFHFQSVPERAEKPGFNVIARNGDNHAKLNYVSVVINTGSDGLLDSVIKHETIHCADDLLNITYTVTKDKTGKLRDMCSGRRGTEQSQDYEPWQEKMFRLVKEGVIDYDEQPILLQQYLDDDYNSYNDTYHSEGFVTQIFRDMSPGASHREALCVAHGLHYVFAGNIKRMRKSGNWKTKHLKSQIIKFLDSIPKGPYYPQIRREMKRYAGSLM